MYDLANNYMQCKNPSAYNITNNQNDLIGSTIN